MTDVPPAPPPSALFKPAVDEKSIVANVQALIDSDLGHYVTGTNATAVTTVRIPSSTDHEQLPHSF
jgi:hypothetical protein